MGELKITGGNWSAFKCPKPGGVAFSPKDQRGQWLVGYHGDIDPTDGAKYAGDIAVFYGENAEGHAKLFAESRTLQGAIDRLTRERDAARAECAAWRVAIENGVVKAYRTQDYERLNNARCAHNALCPDLHTPTTGGQGEGEDFDDGPPCPICGSKSHGYTGHTPNHD